jgi:hypothetical protein
MDGRFLSDPAVVSASRAFVCVRLKTYEDAEEAEVLTSIWVSGRSGVLENTTFALLAPDGRTLLCRPGRSPDFAFRDAAEMSTFMARLAASHPARDVALPYPRVASVRLALDVAACDGLPLVVAHGVDPARLAPLCWGRFAGDAVWAATSDADDLSMITGDAGRGILVVQPDRFGQAGAVLERLPADVDPDRLAAALAKHHAEPVDEREHMRLGERLGVRWETAIPVTDPNGPPPRRR